MSVIFPVTIQGVKAWLGSHDAPHADEAGCWWLIQKFAGPDFLARYSAWQVIGGARYQVIWVGEGGGPLDEHGKDGDECAMSLVAKALSVYDYPPLKRIIDAIRQQDLHGGGEPLSAIRAANSMSRKNPQDPREMINHFGQTLDTIYAEEVGFFEAEKEFPRVVNWERLIAKNGKTIYLAIIRSDSEYMARVAFSKGAAIVLQRNSTGLNQIQARGNIPIDGIHGWLQRHDPGRWHLKGKLLLNGSFTHPDVPPSRCTLEKIEEVIRWGFTKYYTED